jgi:hypothetical protein
MLTDQVCWRETRFDEVVQERGRFTDGAQLLPQYQSYATIGAATSLIP